MKIKEGQLVALSGGEYSDYYVKGYFRAKRDFDSVEEVVRFKREGPYLAPPWKGHEPSEYGSDGRFDAWLVSENILEETDPDTVIELHTGSYNRLRVD